VKPRPGERVVSSGSWERAGSKIVSGRRTVRRSLDIRGLCQRDTWTVADERDQGALLGGGAQQSLNSSITIGPAWRSTGSRNNAAREASRVLASAVVLLSLPEMIADMRKPPGSKPGGSPFVERVPLQAPLSPTMTAPIRHPFQSRDCEQRSD